MSQYFPKPYESFGGDINVEVDLSNYATKTDLKNISHVDVSSFALKSNLASLKTEVDTLDIGKLVPIPVDLSTLSDVVKNDVVKKTEYNKLVKKVDNIDTTNFVKERNVKKMDQILKIDKKITKIDKKIPDVSGLLKKTDFDSKISEVEGKIPSISGLASNSELTAFENKIPDVSSLVKETKFSTKITETVEKIGDRVTSNKSKHLFVENELTLDLSYFGGKNYFEGNDGAQNASVFQTMQKHFNLSNVNQISKWKSKGLFDQYLDAVGTLGDVLLSKPIKSTHVIFKENGTLVQNNNDIIAGGPKINIYIVDKTSPKTINSNFALKNFYLGQLE